MIEFKNVYKTYPNGFTALKNINLQIEQGEFVAIIGLSGAGKLTVSRWTLCAAKSSGATAARSA